MLQVVGAAKIRKKNEGERAIACSPFLVLQAVTISSGTLTMRPARTVNVATRMKRRRRVRSPLQSYVILPSPWDKEVVPAKPGSTGMTQFACVRLDRMRNL